MSIRYLTQPKKIPPHNIALLGIQGFPIMVLKLDNDLIHYFSRIFSHRAPRVGRVGGIRVLKENAAQTLNSSLKSFA
jgi:hypothetical protein